MQLEAVYLEVVYLEAVYLEAMYLEAVYLEALLYVNFLGWKSQILEYYRRISWYRTVRYHARFCKLKS